MNQNNIKPYYQSIKNINKIPNNSQKTSNNSQKTSNNSQKTNTKIKYAFNYEIDFLKQLDKNLDKKNYQDNKDEDINQIFDIFNIIVIFKRTDIIITNKIAYYIISKNILKLKDFIKRFYKSKSDEINEIEKNISKLKDFIKKFNKSKLEEINEIEKKISKLKDFIKKFNKSELEEINVNEIKKINEIEEIKIDKYNNEIEKGKDKFLEINSQVQRMNQLIKEIIYKAKKYNKEGIIKQNECNNLIKEFPI